MNGGNATFFEPERIPQSSCDAAERMKQMKLAEAALVRLSSEAACLSRERARCMQAMERSENGGQWASSTGYEKLRREMDELNKKIEIAGCQLDARHQVYCREYLGM